LLGRCASYGRNVAYGPLADVLRQELELREEAAPETMLARLAGREILGLALGLDVAGDLEPQAAVLALQAEWVRLVSDLAAAGPLVLVVEDLHWAAEPLLELLQLTLADANGPVLVLCGPAELRILRRLAGYAAIVVDEGPREQTLVRVVRPSS